MASESALAAGLSELMVLRLLKEQEMYGYGIVQAIAVRTRQVPFFRSRPSLPLLASALAVVAVGAALPFTPLAGPLGFTKLPATFFAALAGMVAVQ